VSYHNAALSLSAATATVRTNPASAQAHVARQRSNVRLAIGTALFAGNQDTREIPCYRIVGYPVQHLSRIRRCTRQTPEHGPPATREKATPQHLRR